MASRATEFFHQVKDSSDRAGFLRKLVAEKTAEGEFLEFKGGRIDENSAKKYWSQALSGFANTEGGVVIFGIKTDRVEPERGGRKIDTAADLDLVPNPVQLTQLLKDVHLQATVDPVQGVDSLAVSTEPDGAGFAVCLVPEGNNKPYRAELDPTRNYFQRVGDNFVVIPHSLLRSLFYPRSNPRLRLKFSGHAPNVVLRSVRASVQNVGTGSARQLVVIVSSDRPIQSIAGIGEMIADMSGGFAPARCRLVGREALHPGDEYDLFQALWKVSDVQKPWETPPPTITVAFFMADHDAVRFTVRMGLTELESGRVTILEPDVTAPF